MRTSDFRIGNIVSFDNLNECKVIEIKEKHLRVEYIREDTQTIHRPLIEIERIFPLQLSQEKMVLFQFEECGYDFLFWKHDKIPNVQFAGINWADRDIPEYQFLNLRVDREIFKIDFVHQLQNLFHSLTHEDLEIKEIEKEYLIKLPCSFVGDVTENCDKCGLPKGMHML
jgi:hypothetical protein